MKKQYKLQPFTFQKISFFLSICMIMSCAIESNAPSKMQLKRERLMAKFSQEIQMTKDPALGYVPAERLIEARTYTQALIKKNTHRKAAITGVNWTNKGPDNVGGRTRAILFDPNDATHKAAFAGGVSGGLWKNTDITNINSPWNKINDFMDNLAISVLAADPTNPQIMYAGTGEAYTEVTPGLGIFKSVDGGNIWTNLANTTTYNYITDIVVRNESGTSVIYASSKSIYISGLDDYLGRDELIRSTDGGANWTTVIDFESIDDLEIDANNNLLLAYGIYNPGGNEGDILKCTSGCQTAANWSKIYDAPVGQNLSVERTVIATAPDNANYIYAIAGNSNGNQDIGYFIKTTNGGTSWSNLTIPKNYNLDQCSEVSNQHFTRGQATYDLVMTVHPTNENLVLLGGIDMYRTTNGFSTTPHIGSWYEGTAPCNQVIHADQHAILFRPGHPNEVLFGNDGGVYYSNNAGNSAVTVPTFAHHVKDYNVSQLYAADISPIKGAAEYLAGLQDNGTQDWDSTNEASTTEADGGDGGWCHIDQDNNQIQVSSYIYNNYSVTTDEWNSREQMAEEETGMFINPTDYDDTNNVLYGSTDANKLFRITGVGSTNDFVDKITIGGSALQGGRATTIRVDRNTPTTIFVGTNNGKILKINNANTGTLSSSNLSNGIPSDTWISCIDVQLGDSNHMLATISNYGTTSVYESTNGGSSWQAVEGNLPDMPIRWGIFSPANPDQALLATDLGIWSTDDLNGSNTNWEVTNTGLANVRVDMMRWRQSDSTVVAATHGRGLYTFSFTQSFNCIDNIEVTDNPAAGTYQAGVQLTTNDAGAVNVSSSAVFKAGNNIMLNGEFSVNQGATFEASIEDCP